MSGAIRAGKLPVEVEVMTTSSIDPAIYSPLEY